MKILSKYIFLLIMMSLSNNIYSNSNSKGRIMVICAHPDDVELTSGGTLTLLANIGYQIKSVSVTNGNKGHYEGTPKEIAERRMDEISKVKDLLGCEYEVLNIDDGELEANLKNRFEIIRVIREWNPDIVITHPPYDYHPDHRNTSILVQDASFLITVPKLMPQVPAMTHAPLFLYTRGRYTNPVKPIPDIVIDISSVIQQKAKLIDAHESQIYEWLPWINKLPAPNVNNERERIDYVTDSYVLKRGAIQPQDIDVYQRWYFQKPTKAVQAIEAFEISEFGRTPTDEEIRNLFRMYPSRK